MNHAVDYEAGPVTRAEQAERGEINAISRSADNFRRAIRAEMALKNLTVAACPYAHDVDASESLIAAHKEANDLLGIRHSSGCAVNRYLSEE